MKKALEQGLENARKEAQLFQKEAVIWNGSTIEIENIGTYDFTDFNKNEFFNWDIMLGIRMYQKTYHKEDKDRPSE